MSDLMAVTVIGNDRPGIVSGVTEVLFDLGCNLEDVTSTILRGHFAMMLIVRSPDDPAVLEERLREVAGALELVVTVREVDEVATPIPEPTHMVSVYGADRPGIVFRVSQLLAAKGANVTDLTSRVIGSAEAPVYAVLLEVSLPEGLDLEGDFADLRERLGVDVSMHPIEADVL